MVRVRAARGRSWGCASSPSGRRSGAARPRRDALSSDRRDPLSPGRDGLAPIPDGRSCGLTDVRARSPGRDGTLHAWQTKPASTRASITTSPPSRSSSGARARPSPSWVRSPPRIRPRMRWRPSGSGRSERRPRTGNGRTADDAKDFVTSSNRARDLTWLVALAAALWGTDALLRLPLALQVAAPTIVFGEHVVLVLVLLPFLPLAIRAFRTLDTGGK